MGRQATKVRRASKTIKQTEEAEEFAAEMRGELDPSTPKLQPQRLGVTHYLGKHLQPWWIMAGLLVAAGIIAGFTWLAEWAFEAEVSVWVGLTSAGLAALFGVVRFAQVRGSLDRGWQVRRALNYAAASAWLYYATTSFGWMAVALLAFGGCVLSARHWQVHRFDWDTKPAEPEAPKVRELSYVDRWDYGVGDSGKALPGSYLTDESEAKAYDGTRIGPRYTIQLVAGDHTIENVRSNLLKIASGLDVRTSDVMVEAHPSEKPSRAVLTILENTPIRGDVLFEGLKYEKGSALLGPYADGQGEAPWRIYEKGGDGADTGSMWGGCMIAQTGSGKSKVAENIAFNQMLCPDPTVVWFCDPQNGVSSPTLTEHADWYVDGSGLRGMIDAAKRIAFARGQESGNKGWTGFDPKPCTCPCTCKVPSITTLRKAHAPMCPIRLGLHKAHGCGYRPGISIIIDESHQPLADAELAKDLSDLSRMTRKLGISYTLISQYAGLPTFGGLEPLRSSIMAGNALVMYTRSRSAGNLMAGLEVDPLTIPQIPGFAYTMRTGATGRVAPFRNRLVTKPVDRWVVDAPHWSLNEQDALWAGEEYANRATDVSQVRAAQADLLARVEAGEITPEQAMAGAKTPQEAHDIAVRASGKPGAMETGPVADRMRDLVASVPAWPGANVKVSDIQVPESPEALDSKARIVAAIKSGAAKPSQIQAAVELKQTRVQNLLTELIADGEVVREGWGTYRLTTEQDGSAA